jgi:hypothetical protein
MSYEEPVATEISWTELIPCGPNVDHHLKRFLCYSVLSVAAETSEPLPSKLTSASAAIPAFRQCLLSPLPSNGLFLHNMENFIMECKCL